jgi:hypothetical protein
MNALGIPPASFRVRSPDAQHRHAQRGADDGSDRIVRIDPSKGQCDGRTNSCSGVPTDRLYRRLNSLAMRHDHGHGTAGSVALSYKKLGGYQCGVIACTIDARPFRTAGGFNLA